MGIELPGRTLLIGALSGSLFGIEKTSNAWVFFECPELKSVVFPVSTYKIGDQAFRQEIRATFLDGDTSCFSANNTQRSFVAGTTIISAPGTNIRHDAYLNGFKWEALGTYDLSTAGVGNNKKVDVTFDFAEYTGKPVTPLKAVRVNANPDKYAEGILLTKDVDYTVTYSNNINAGTGIATITGKGDYIGTITREFTITGSGTPTTQSISNATMTLPYTTKEYTGVEFKNCQLLVIPCFQELKIVL